MLRVLALSRYGRLGASSRLRLYQYAPYLQRSNIEVVFSPLLRDEYLVRLYAGKKAAWEQIFIDYMKRFHALLDSRAYDVLWIEKELFPDLPSWFELFLKVCGVPFVVDYDDAIFHSYDLSHSGLRRLMPRKIDKVMSYASLVVCGNNYLAARAQRAGARRVDILPTVIDLNRYSVRVKSPQTQLVIGWMGSPSTVKYLEIIQPAIRACAELFPIKLVVVGAQFCDGIVPTECHEWSEATEVSEIQQFDIGVMPLLDSPWEQGKCGYKLIQYMACGVPVIASPVGVNATLVCDGDNGYLAESVDEWLLALRKLCADSLIRQAMGQRGRELVEHEYCLQVAAPRLINMLNDVFAGPNH